MRTAALLAGLAGAVCGVAGPAVATEATTPAVAPGSVASATLTDPARLTWAPAATRTTATKQAIAVAVVRTRASEQGQAVFSLVGAADQKQAQVLRLASSAAFLALRPRYAPATVPRDRYTYQIEVGYRDSSKKRVTVVQGTPGTPKVALDLIRLMTDVEPPDLSDLSDLPVSFPPGFPFN
ncbi:hypothetical protein FHX34_104368 [Actinoplanes teichomyceticus]|uniref:Uncharacterized protein n=2 Tax=Actinoplanes teichomyceticus TaxID=1867 RepID=A0A561VR23_ACTTI|nr:hypothetical protein FHX34_104368 [Actinoplanes teichomyceticus]GIF13371.1 hypothetical protein Ate01nite_34030 [Actinoplanes teichomyceticus]